MNARVLRNKAGDVGTVDYSAYTKLYCWIVRNDNLDILSHGYAKKRADATRECRARLDALEHKHQTGTS